MLYIFLCEIPLPCLYLSVTLGVQVNDLSIASFYWGVVFWTCWEILRVLINVDWVAGKGDALFLLWGLGILPQVTDWVKFALELVWA